MGRLASPISVACLRTLFSGRGLAIGNETGHHRSRSEFRPVHCPGRAEFFRCLCRPH
jgi:hypothetical protein